jgi:AcrR family transcriptional regulator
MTNDGAELRTVDPASLRERKKERTRRELVAAALRLFEQKGYDATTVDEIAAAAEVSPRTFFRYFADKEEVAMGEVFDQSVIDLVNARPAGEPLVESLRHVVAGSLGLMNEGDREALLPRLKIVYRTPSLRGRRWEYQLRFGRVAGVALAGRLGLPPDDLGSRVTATAALMAVEVAMDRWQERDGRDDLGELLQAAVSSLGAAFGG